MAVRAVLCVCIPFLGRGSCCRGSWSQFLSGSLEKERFPRMAFPCKENCSGIGAWRNTGGSGGLALGQPSLPLLPRCWGEDEPGGRAALCIFLLFFKAAIKWI